MKADLKPFEHKMNKTIEVLGKELAAIRAGRANPGVLDRITVEYYGAPTPLNQVAAVLRLTRAHWRFSRGTLRSCARLKRQSRLRIWASTRRMTVR